MAKREKSQADPSLAARPGGQSASAKEVFKPGKGTDNLHGQAARQDGKNTDKRVESFAVGGWKHEHSMPGEKKSKTSQSSAAHSKGSGLPKYS